MHNGREEYPGSDRGGLGRALMPVVAVAALLVGFTLLTAKLTSNGGGEIRGGSQSTADATTTAPPRGTFLVQGATVDGADQGDPNRVLDLMGSTESPDGDSGGDSNNSTTTTEQTSTTVTTDSAGAETTTSTNTPSSGNVVWVDSNTSGAGNGSESAPFATIGEGVLAVRAGETLMIKGGTYREQVNPGYRAPMGTSDARITMTNAPGERVVIQGRVILTDVDYWTISGINVTWDDGNDDSVTHMVIMNGGVDWVWENSEFWGAKAFAAILVAGQPRNFTLRKLYIHDTLPTNDTNQDHLIYCNCGTGGGTIERNLLVNSANGRAVKVGGADAGDPSIGNVVIRNNTMVGNLGPSSVQLSFDTSNITVDRNIMVDAQSYAHNINSFELTGSNNRASNNIGWDSQGVVNPDIDDGGGNIYRNPQLQPGSNYSSYKPADDQSQAYGHLAP